MGIKTEEVIENVVNEKPVKIIEIENTVVKEGKAESIKELSHKFDSIEHKAVMIYEKVNHKKKKKKKR